MIGSELRSRRERMELSQAGLAARLGVNPNTVARWERDDLSIPPYLRPALQYLQLEIEEEWRNQTQEERHERNLRNARRLARAARFRRETARSPN